MRFASAFKMRIDIILKFEIGIGVNGIQVAYCGESGPKGESTRTSTKDSTFPSHIFSWETPMFRWPRPKVVECPLERRSWERIPTLVRVFCKKRQGKDEL